MITKFINYIKESPDTLRFKDGSDPASWEDDDALPFFITVSPGHDEVDNIYIGGFGGSHGSIDYDGFRRERAYPGRLWLDRKVLTFWVYPNIKLFKNILKKLEEELDYIKIFNNGWKVEVLQLKSGDYLRQEFDPDIEPEDYWFGLEDMPVGGNYILIPVEKYEGSENVPEEIQIQHLMNWKEKDIAKNIGKIHFGKWGSYKTGWDQPHNIKYRQAIYQENNNLIKESPDNVKYTDKRGKEKILNFSASDALPFFFTVNKEHTEVEETYLGNYGRSHASIENPFWTDEEKFYSGRLWKRKKIISFWVYPNEVLFVSIIKSLEKELKLKIFNNGWKVEVNIEDGKIRKRDVQDNFQDFYFGSRFSFNKKEKKLIPVEEYVGSENFPDELRIQHMMNWEEKEKARKEGSLKVTGGSHKTAWDSPHNIKYRQAIYQENKKN